MTPTRIIGISICLLGFAAMCSAGVEAVTMPCRDLQLSFAQPGRVAKVLVKEGDIVAVGTPLMQMEDEAERADLEQLKAQADDEVRIKAAAAQLDQKRVDLKNLQIAFKKGAATSSDVDHADLDVTIADLSLDLAKFTRTQDQLKYKAAKIHVERMLLLSPVAGRVEKISVREGEAVDGSIKAMRVVKIDPLWIDVPMPLLAAQQLKVGQQADVAIADNPKVSLVGQVLYVACCAEPASNTLTVRVEVPNPDMRQAGEHVNVSFRPMATTMPATVPATMPTTMSATMPATAATTE